MKVNKKCCKCKEVKWVSQFHKSKTGIHGVRRDCKECRKEYAAKHYLKNKTEILNRNREWAKNNPEYDKERMRRYRAADPEKYLELNRKYQRENRKKTRASCTNWRKNNLGYDAYRSSLRRKHIKQATPDWANLDKIKEIYLLSQEAYEETCIKYHVDHIIPLKGKDVCGLNIIQNLQLLSAEENIKKGNRYDT